MRAAVVLLIVLVISGTVVWLTVGAKPAAPSEVVNKIDPLEAAVRGKYLVTICDCNGCHTPHDERGEPVMAKMLSGHPEGAPLPTWEPGMMENGVLATISPTLTAFAGPFGVSVTPNLTPDPETGMAGLSEQGLVDSWKSGKHWMFDRPVLPPMPIGGYKDMKEEDIRAIYHYLRTIPPIKNKAPNSVLPKAP